MHYGNVYINGRLVSIFFFNPILSGTLIQEMNVKRTKPSLNVTSSCSPGQD